MLSIQTLVPDSARGKITGLMGNFDSDDSNDIQSASGSIICNSNADCDAKVQDVHFLFGESCMFTT